MENLFKYGFNVGAKLPNLSICDVDGNEFMLYDLFKHYKRVVISLEVDWCPYCRKQNENIINLKSFSKEELFIPIFTRYSKSKYKGSLMYTNAYIKKSGLKDRFRCYFDIDDVFFNSFDIHGTPTNIIIDQNGYIRTITQEYDADKLLKEFRPCS